MCVYLSLREIERACERNTTVPSSYDIVEDIAQVITMLYNTDEVSLSQEGMQKTDTEATCQQPSNSTHI